MNILFLFYAPILPYVGGIQRATENLAKELKARGHSVCYLSSNNNGKDIKYDSQIPQFYLDESLNKELYLDSYLRLVKSRKIDVIINQEPRDDLLYLLANTPVYIKKITCFHSQPFPSQDNPKLMMKYYKPKGLKAYVYRFICRLFPSYYSHHNLILERKLFDKTLSLSDRLCLESEHYFHRMQKYMPDLDVSKLVAVGNSNSFPPVVLKEQKEKLFLWVGRQINTPKNIPAFIDFWVSFKKRYSDWKACIIGVGPDMEFNKIYAAEKKVSDLEFLGYVEDITSYYKKATFFMMTSMYEGFPMVLLEAMSNGCIPCAYDTFESLHDIIDDGVNGIISHPYDRESMIKSIGSVLDGAGLIPIMRDNAMKKSELFSVDIIADRWEKIFKDITNE